MLDTEIDLSKALLMVEHLGNGWPFWTEYHHC